MFWLKKRHTLYCCLEVAFLPTDFKQVASCRCALWWVLRHWHCSIRFCFNHAWLVHFGIDCDKRHVLSCLVDRCHLIGVSCETIARHLSSYQCCINNTLATWPFLRSAPLDKFTSETSVFGAFVPTRIPVIIAIFHIIKWNFCLRFQSKYDISLKRPTENGSGMFFLPFLCNFSSKHWFFSIFLKRCSNWTFIVMCGSWRDNGWAAVKLSYVSCILNGVQAKKETVYFGGFLFEFVSHQNKYRVSSI